MDRSSKQLGLRSVALAWAGLGLMGTAAAALQGRDINGQPVAPNAPTAVFEYDTDLDITWLRNWNPLGARSWSTAASWAARLQVGRFSGWRLPAADPGCGIGFDCRAGEIGHLRYVELAAWSRCAPATWRPCPSRQAGC